MHNFFTPPKSFWVRVARWPVLHLPDRYITANLAEAGKKPVF